MVVFSVAGEQSDVEMKGDTLIVYASDDEGKADLIERIESRHGVHTIEAAAEIGVGSREYELIDMDVK